MSSEIFLSEIQYPYSSDLPEFSAFLKSVRISQIVQEKIRRVSTDLEEVQSASLSSATINERLNDVEKRMAELLHIRKKHLKKPR